MKKTNNDGKRLLNEDELNKLVERLAFIFNYRFESSDEYVEQIKPITDKLVSELRLHLKK